MVALLILPSLVAIAKAFVLVMAGYGWIETSRVDLRGNVLERIVLGICLGLTGAVISSSLVIAARLPFDSTDYAVVIFAIFLIVVWLLSKPNLTMPVGGLRVVSKYWLPIVLFLFHLILWTTYLVDYPYFPNTEPPDAVFHAEITLSVLQGAFSSPIGPTGLAGGAHILFAFVSSYFGMSVIAAERVTAAFVESFTILVAYCLFQRILPSKLAGDYASVAYAIIIPAGFVYFANVGAYPNIIGDFIVLTSLLLVAIIMPEPKVRSVTTAALVEVIALISHVTALIFLLLIVGFSLVVFTRFRTQFRGYVLSNLGFFLVPITAVISLPSLVGRELSYVSGLYLNLNNDLGLVLQIWIHNYLFLAGDLNAVLLIAALVLVAFKFRRSFWPSFLASWFSLLIFLVFIGTQDWRMVLLSLVPGAGLLGILLSKVHGWLDQLLLPRIRALRRRRAVVTSMMFLLIVVMAAGGPSPYALSHAFSNSEPTEQRYIYASMVWLEENTSSTASVITVGIPLEYRYLPVVANRTYVGNFQLNSTGIMKLQSSLGFNFVVVSTNFSGLNTFYISNSFRVKYQNPDVVIFRLQA